MVTREDLESFLIRMDMDWSEVDEGMFLVQGPSGGVVVHLCPAVPTAPNKMLGIANSMFAVGVTTIALFPPSSSMVRPRRFPTTSATRLPTPAPPRSTST